ncbi:MAG: hypothetical protein ACXWP0_01100 [Ktedonobacterales bacterium]
MIDIPTAQLHEAIIDGFDLSGSWYVCRKSGAIYWQHRFIPSSHAGHSDVAIPALYAEGVASQRRLFLSWLRALPDRQRMSVLEALLYPDFQGNVYALPCIIEQFLTADERTSWCALVNARIMMIAEGTLQVLNAPHGRPRYRYAPLAH